MRRSLVIAAALATACAKGQLPSYDDLGPPDFAHAGGGDMAGGKPDLTMSAKADLTMIAGDDAAPPMPDLAPSGKCILEVNELQTAGLGGTTDEFVEIYNPCNVDVPLAGYTLVYEAAAGVNQVVLVTFANMTLTAAKPYLVAAHKNYTGASDVTYSLTSMASAGGAIGIVDANMKLLDSVGYGTATNKLVEGTAAPAPPSAKSIERLPDGHDSDDNSLDLKVGNAPTPGAANQ